MAQKASWHERFFGRQLLKCESVQQLQQELMCAGEALKGAEYVGVYFSFANFKITGDDFTKKLKEVYERVNSESNSEGKRFEVVQVVLWANNDVYADFEDGHTNNLLNLPWFAIPFNEIDLKTKLTRRYRIKSGVTTLVILDREGATVSASAQDCLTDDPLGLSFPWRPRPVDQVLKDIELQPGGTHYEDHPLETKKRYAYSDLPEGVKGFYFSANWVYDLPREGRKRITNSVFKVVEKLKPAGIKADPRRSRMCPPCRAFTPQLVEAYRLIRKREPGFEIIFVSSDRSLESFSVYVEHMPWLVVPYQQMAVRAELAQLYGVRGIPTLLLLDRNGHLITMDARADLADDPLAHNFPWRPRAVNILTERFVARLHDYPAIILFVDGEETDVQFAESVLTPAANLYCQKHNVSFTSCDDFLAGSDRLLHFLIGVDSDASDLVRDLIGLDDVVPLLVAVDLSRRRVAMMEYGVEITAESVGNYLEKFQAGDLEFRSIDQDDDANDVK